MEEDASRFFNFFTALVVFAVATAGVMIATYDFQSLHWIPVMFAPALLIGILSLGLRRYWQGLLYILLSFAVAIPWLIPETGIMLMGIIVYCVVITLRFLWDFVVFIEQ